MKSIRFILPVTSEHTVVIQEDRLPTAYRVPHHHEAAQITLIQKGSGTFYIGNTAHPFADGDLFLVDGGASHYFKSDPPDFHATHIFFHTPKIQAASKHLFEFKSLGSFLEMAPMGLKLSTAAHVPICERMCLIKAGTDLERLLHLLHLLQYLSLNRTEMEPLLSGTLNTAPSERMRLEAVYQYTLTHFTEDISLSHVASIACLTTPAFCKYFKKHTRKTYFSFLNEIRVREACKRILSRDYHNIASVAYATGFNNAITFNRVFKRIIGKCPSDYLEENSGVGG
jgi:AraC-like DNA-binding protein/quercetin dioxygenase-like cupin family protein